eukprot:UN33249
MMIYEFLKVLHKSEEFESTRLDKYSLDWVPKKTEKLLHFLHGQKYAQAVSWLEEEEAEQKFAQIKHFNSRSNTTLVNQIKTRKRDNFVESNDHQDALLFDDIYYILKIINESKNALVYEDPLTQELLSHTNQTMDEACQQILEECSKKNHGAVVHVYVLKNNVETGGSMGHWTVLCYERQKDNKEGWRLSQYYNPSGQGFRCGDRCIQWILTHALQQKYIHLPIDLKTLLLKKFTT